MPWGMCLHLPPSLRHCRFAPCPTFPYDAYWGVFSIHAMHALPFNQRKLTIGSVYFTENSGYQSLKNRSCVTVFGSCSVTLTVGEPLGDVSGSANHDSRTSVTGIFGEIDASLTIMFSVFKKTMKQHPEIFLDFSLRTFTVSEKY